MSASRSGVGVAAGVGVGVSASSGSAFGRASITDLRAMIAGSNPATLDTVAARWAAVALALQQAQEDFAHHTRAATANWTGTAADAFAARATELHHTIGNGADYASHASSGVSYAAEALRAARTDMPPEPASLEGVVTSEQARTAGTTADALHEQQRKRAVAVMEQLEERYAAAAEMIGTPASLEQNHDRGAYVPRAGTAPSQPRQAELMTEGPHLTARSTGVPDQSGGSRRGSAGNELASLPYQASASTSAPGTAEAIRNVAVQKGQSGEIRLSELADCRPDPAAGLASGPSAGGIAGIHTSPQATTTPSPLRTEFSSPSPPWNVSPGALPSEIKPNSRGTSNARSRVADGATPGSGTLPEVTGGGIKEVMPGSGTKNGQQLGEQLAAPTSLSMSPGWLGPHTMRNRPARRRNRPEYLTEDERTWLCELNVNPPVIT